MGYLRGCVACHQTQCCLCGVGSAAAVVERAHEQLWFSELLQAVGIPHVCVGKLYVKMLLADRTYIRQY